MTKRLVCILFVLAALPAWAARTDFYTTTTGTNTNSGWSANDTADYTSLNGNWDGTSVFTPTDGSTPASSITNGAFGSVFTNTDSRTYYVARISTVAAGVNGAITFATAPTNMIAPGSQNGTVSLKVGGAWGGPSGAVGFPVGFFCGQLTNAAGDAAWCNIKGTHIITAGMTDALKDEKTIKVFQGFTTTPQDGGLGIIDGSTTSASFTELTLNAKNTMFADIWFRTNGTTSGNAVMVTDNATGSENIFYRCIFSGSRGKGINFNSVNEASTCEFYTNGLNNSSGDAAMVLASSGAKADFCYIHDNTGANIAGVRLDGGVVLENSVVANNGIGALSTADVLQHVTSCDFFNNKSDGIRFNGGAADPLLINVKDCNFFLNNGYAISFNPGVSALYHDGIVVNCAFGSGSQTNASGYLSNTNGLITSGWITYASGMTPWVDPTNGNFTPITGAIGKWAGYGTFLHALVNSPTNTVSYLDIGAAQATNTVSGGGTTSHGFAQ